MECKARDGGGAGGDEQERGLVNGATKERKRGKMNTSVSYFCKTAGFKNLFFCVYA